MYSLKVSQILHSGHSTQSSFPGSFGGSSLQPLDFLYTAGSLENHLNWLAWGLNHSGSE